MVETSIQMWLTYGVVILAIMAYSVDKIPLEISCFSTVAILLVIFYFIPLENTSGDPVISSRDLLAGFADPALITIMSLLVVGQGLVQTGALNRPAQWLINKGEQTPKTIVFVTFLIVMLLSAVINNTPVVVMFIPIMGALAAKMGQQSARVMMPLSYVAILGGNLTLIGSSTNLLAAGAYSQAGGDPLSFFSFTIPGLILAAVGFCYILFIMPRFLKSSPSMIGRLSSSSGKQFLFQLELDSDSKLVGETAISGIFPGMKDLTVRMIQRGRQKLLPPYDDLTLEIGDVVMVAATRSTMADILSDNSETITSAEGVSKTAHKDGVNSTESDESGRRMIAEAVVAPASRLVGRTIALSGFRSDTACTVLGVQRRSRMIRAALSQLPLEAGDVLLVMGKRVNVLGLRDNRDVMLMESSATDIPMTEYAFRAQLIFGGVVALASTGFMPITIAALAGAVSMLISGCLNVRQAGRAIDARIFAIVGAALALGTAMQATGGAAYLAQGMVSALSEAPVWVLLSGFFLMIALLTNVLSNNATAVLFTPVAVSVALELGLDPLPFMLAVIFGANCSFATPMGYQTNLLVMGPGHYQFIDYIKAGLPLIFITWITFTIVIPWYYGF